MPWPFSKSIAESASSKLICNSRRLVGDAATGGDASVMIFLDFEWFDVDI